MDVTTKVLSLKTEVYDQARSKYFKVKESELQTK
jgi:hypothetical protein